MVPGKNLFISDKDLKHLHVQMKNIILAQGERVRVYPTGIKIEMG